MFDAIEIIKRIHARGALIKVLDKPHLDLTTPLGRGFIRLPIGNGRVKKSSTDHAVVSSSSQTVLEKSISRVTPDKNGSTRAPRTGRASRSPAEIWSHTGARWRRIGLQTKCRHAHGFLRRQQLLCEPPIAHLAAAAWRNKPHRSLLFHSAPMLRP